ncbi:hypothetical protein Drorol1_Dr00022083 [Drosera rotundifolia]
MSRQASSNQRYDDFRNNVERTKLIQIGETLSNNCGNVGGRGSLICLISTWNSIQGLLIRSNSSARLASTSLRWITFNGLYDLVYILLMLNELPMLLETMNGFLLRPWFGSEVYDVKNDGVAQHAGSDSLFTVKLFAKMRDKGLNVQRFQGCVNGIERNCENPNPMIAPPLFSHPPPIVFYPWPPLGLMGYTGGLSYRF